MFSNRYDFRLKFFNMKKNVNMNTLTGEEKQVNMKKRQSHSSDYLFDHHCFWMTPPSWWEYFPDWNMKDLFCWCAHKIYWKIDAGHMVPKRYIKWLMQGIWVPKLVFANTEQKINTKNDEKAFAVARYMYILLPIDLIYLMLSLHNFVPNMISAKAPNSVSNRLVHHQTGETRPTRTATSPFLTTSSSSRFLIHHLCVNSHNVNICSGWRESLCLEPCLRCRLDLRVRYGVVPLWHTVLRNGLRGQSQPFYKLPKTNISSPDGG